MPESLHNILDHYVCSVRGKVAMLAAGLRAATTDTERAEMIRLVHQLAGSGASMGFPRLSAPATAIELLLEAGRNRAFSHEESEQISVLVALMECIADGLDPAASTLERFPRGWKRSEFHSPVAAVAAPDERPLLLVGGQGGEGGLIAAQVAPFGYDLENIEDFA
ncbi:MAG: Hpt domain-containing protein, partial [Rhodospirillales bacterium]|nr:Hpt domain-containing protein [Rhodospirillales bacterium]